MKQEFLKYNIKHNIETINHICEIMEEIVRDEVNILIEVKSELYQKLREQEANLYCLM